MRTPTMFQMPTLAIKLDPDKLRATFAQSTLLDNVSDKEWCRPVPYGDYLQQCISFDIKRFDTPIGKIKKALATASAPDDLMPSLRALRSLAHTEFEQHFVRVLDFHAIRLLENDQTNRTEQFQMYVDGIAQPTGVNALYWLAASGCVAFPDFSADAIAKAAVEFNMEGHASPTISAGSRIVAFKAPDLLECTIRTFAGHMRLHGLYLHQCPVCKQWFVRYDKRRSAFCGKNACLQQPKATAKKRHVNKVKTQPHWTAYNKDYHYWYQNYNRGNLSKEQFEAWQAQAEKLRDFVETGVKQLSEFEEWLALCRTKRNDITPQTPNKFWKEN